MTYLGIDPGTACGWALLSADGTRIASGVWDLASQRHEGAGMRYLRLRSYLTQVYNSDGKRLKAVGYEEVSRHVGTDAAHVYGGIVATLQAWCESNRTPYQGQPVSSVKRLATGKGVAGKETMIAAANARWGTIIRVEKKTLTNKKTGLPTEVFTFPGGGDNEADALWIAEALRKGLT